MDFVEDVPQEVDRLIIEAEECMERRDWKKLRDIIDKIFIIMN